MDLQQKISRASTFAITESAMLEVLNSVKDDVQEQISIAFDKIANGVSIQEISDDLQAKINEIFK